jgi:hypothetical protein
MSATTSESLSPLGEPQASSRKKRLSRLTRIVFELMGERYHGVTNPEFDGVEDAALLNALRVCSLYTDLIGCSDYGDRFVVEIEGIDGHNYIIQFLIFSPEISVHASRVRVTNLPQVGRAGRVESTYIRKDVLDEYTKRLKLGGVTTDRAFLVGMSLIIGFMDDQDDDPDEDARLEPLSALVRPTDDELREIRAKLTPSTINYDEEGELPY